jgi:hypothetical protein
VPLEESEVPHYYPFFAAHLLRCDSAIFFRVAALNYGNSDVPIVFNELSLGAHPSHSSQRKGAGRRLKYSHTARPRARFGGNDIQESVPWYHDDIGAAEGE